MKDKIKKAEAMCIQIADLYNQLTTEDSGFFDAYHDIMQIQRDAAWDDLEEMEEYAKEGKEVSVNYIFNNISNALKYCKAVIKLQKATINLPEIIYG